MQTLKTILFLVLATIGITLYAQDVIITVTGKHYDTALELDSIKVFNYSNGTILKLTNLPGGITDYEINLTEGSYHSVNSLQNNNERIEQYSNELNKSVILVAVSVPQQVYLDVFDVSGKLLRSSEIECTKGENLVEVNTNCVSIIRVRTSYAITGYRSVGIGNNSDLSINRINAIVTNRHTEIEKSSIKSNFSYQPGDSLKITACKDTYHSNFVVKTPEHLDHYIIYLSKPCPGTETLSDFDGNVYNTVHIGSQCWMKENLKTMHYADGTALVDGTGVPTIDATTKYWFDYDDNPENSEIYGKLYPWAAVMNEEESSSTAPSGVQGVCPDGWHVPSSAEWDTLTNYLGGANIAGGKLKTSGYEYWNYPNTGANNKSGFSALAGGRLFLTDYEWLNQECFFSVCTEDSSPLVFLLFTLNWSSTCGSDAGTQQHGHSVRCVKD